MDQVNATSAVDATLHSQEQQKRQEANLTNIPFYTLLQKIIQGFPKIMHNSHRPPAPALPLVSMSVGCGDDITATGQSPQQSHIPRAAWLFERC